MQNITLKLMAGLLALASTGLQASDGLPDILRCAASNIPANLTLRQVELETTDRSGKTSIIEARIYAVRDKNGGDGRDGDGLLRAMMQVDAPEYLSGAAYLVRETNDFLRDGMFVYLPAVGRVRRVTGSFTDGALMGTKFSYFEFKQLTNAFRDLSPRVQGQEKIGGRDATVVQFKPLAGAETKYTSVRAWFDQQSCLPLRADFKQGDTVVKRLTAPPSAIQKAGDHWYLDELRMRVLGDDSESIMRVNNVSVDEPVSQVYFDPETFYTVQ